MDLIRPFDEIEDKGIALAGYTSGLCGEWTPERFEALAGQLGIAPSAMVLANEHHTDVVYVAEARDAGRGVVRPHSGDPFDAIITRERGLLLCVKTADCVPVALLDPVKGAAGIVHSGWVGSSKRIAGKTVRKMTEALGCRPENILCSIGPYNRSCCYEVGEDVRSRFREMFSDGECESLFRKKDGGAGKYLLDLGAAVSLSLCQEGVDPAHIHDSGHCTFHTSTFSSWRRTRDKKNQILTYILLRR
ncbi:MAG: peptidoglycan editing factor PgeF [Synergistaceae bacterium]|nr:peptidoglycan editing factor PgeF [Synergistaceae bacterium]